MELLPFTPIYMERIWGGRDLELKLGRTLPEGKVIGESWAKLKKGGNYLQAYVTSTNLSASDPATILITDQF
jgi:mannose-6-phosphate isomerase class I